MTGLSITNKIYEILDADQQFKAMCSHYYPLIAEEDVTFPFVIYRRDGIEAVTTKSCIAGDKVDFTFVIVSDKYAPTVDIAERIRKLFEGRRDGYFNAVILTSSEEEYANDAYTQRLSFTSTILNQNN